MGKFGILSLGLFALQAVLVSGQEAAGDVEEPAIIPNLALTISTSFPASEIFGVKLVNGHPTLALVSFTNDEPDPVTVNIIGGSLLTLDVPGQPSRNVHNLTATKYQVEIPAGKTENLSYSFATEMHPQDLRLHLAAIVSNSEGAFFSFEAFNGTVSIVEPETSIFDPQIIFLYFFILACFTGIIYFFYTVWVAPYFPQKRKGGKGGDRAKKPSDLSKSSGDADQISGGGTDGSTTAKTYDTEWIPAHHINRPEPRKVKSGSSRSKARA